MRFISAKVRPLGSLIALAIGDALGAPLEGSPQPAAWVTQMLPGGRHFRKKGDWTDDTLQAVAVAESLVACEGFSENDIVEKLSGSYIVRPEWFGPTSSAFFNLVRSGILPHRATELVHKRNRGSRSNGSVMRGFPLGIFYPPGEVYGISLACSRITHFDPVPGHCSAFLNVIVSSLCRGSSRTQALRLARSLCSHPEVYTVLGNYRQYDPVPGLDAVQCSHAALSCFMDARSLEQAVMSAVNLGGDADTVGACCGALAGAHWGLDAIPLRWSTELEGYPALVRLGEDLWRSGENRRTVVRPAVFQQA